MKKIGYALMLAAMIAACSSDDNSVEGPKTEEGVLKSLKLQASTTTVVVGGEVIFTLLDDAGKEVDGAVMLDGKEITKKYVFDKVGVFKVVGAKKGFNASNEVTITVSEKELAPLTLKASTTEVEVGQKVTFEVMSKDAAVKEGVKIFDVKANKELAGMEFVATAAGEFEFLAKGEGFADSEKVTVKVKEAVKVREAGMILNGIAAEFSMVSLEIEMVKGDVNNGKAAAKEVKMKNGAYGNQYSIVLGVAKNDKISRGFIFIDFLVENPTIKVDASGKVIDYGTRMLPDNKSNIEMESIYIGPQEAAFIDLGSKLQKYVFDFVSIKFDKEPSKPGTYKGIMDFDFTYTSSEGIDVKIVAKEQEATLKEK
ncbi:MULTISPECIES: hypothetical protein [unclassified Myroides]|uniref:hypothetical protein n=1 Tax=unclassified Myroides TaxID=2642485 RepID=UPI0031010791